MDRWTKAELYIRTALVAGVFAAMAFAEACSTESKADGGHDLTCAPISAGTLSGDAHRCENDEVVCYAMGAAFSCVRR